MLRPAALEPLLPRDPEQRSSFLPLPSVTLSWSQSRRITATQCPDWERLEVNLGVFSERRAEGKSVWRLSLLSKLTHKSNPVQIGFMPQPNRVGGFFPAKVFVWWRPAPWDAPLFSSFHYGFSLNESDLAKMFTKHNCQMQVLPLDGLSLRFLIVLRREKQL